MKTTTKLLRRLKNSNQSKYFHITQINRVKSPIVSANLVTRDNDKIAEKTGNIYESLVVISRRARQISIKIKEELNSKLAEFASKEDNLEEIFENREQIEISKYYERMPKPSTLATEEFLEDKIMFRHTGIASATPRKEDEK